MPWVRARLRDQIVYARANDDGSFQVDGGTVEVRYKPSDGRMYRARAQNLQVVDPKLLPDSTCADAQPVDKAPSSGPASGGGNGRSGSSSNGRPGAGKVDKASAAASASARALPTNAIVAYTDGACSGNPGPAGVGMVLIDGDKRSELSEYLGTATNNIAELTAVLRALERAPQQERPLVVHTDSQYAIGVLTKGWKAKANTELVKKIRDALAARRGVELVYVPGHAGVPLNERADELARLAVERRRTQQS